MNELSLFSGVGGGLLATKHLLDWKIIGYVEIDKYCQAVLVQRIADGYLDPAPIFGDIKQFIKQGYAEAYKGMVDVITAGFPCQPFSVAGKQEGKQDERNMWPETIRIIQKVKPEFVLLENVRGIQQYLPVVIRDLRRTGYTVKRPAIVAAASLGAGHIRNRVWIYAYLDKKGRQNNQGITASEEITKKWTAACLANKEISPDTCQFGGDKIYNQDQQEKSDGQFHKRIMWWKAEPGVVRVVYGISHGMERIKALGNAQVPIVAATAWKILNNG